MQKVANRIDLVSNYADYMELYNEGQLNSDLPAIFSQEKIDEWRAAGNSDPVKYPNSDWQDALFQTGWMQNHTININGGSDKIHYYISGNYMNNPGIMENSGYERYSARVNLDAEVKDWFTIGVNAYGTRGKEELGLLKTESNDNFYTYMQATTPGICYQAPDGRYGGVNNPEDDPQSSSNNVLKMLNDVKGNRTTNNIVSRFYAQLRPFKGLKDLIRMLFPTSSCINSRFSMICGTCMTIRCRLPELEFRKLSTAIIRLSVTIWTGWSDMKPRSTG